MADNKIRNCKIHNSWSKMIFTWDAGTNTWTLHEGPNGPCGSITIGTLEKDKSSKNIFWVYREKHIFTIPDGQLPWKQSCKEPPDIAHNYSWRSKQESLGCGTIESEMDD